MALAGITFGGVTIPGIVETVREGPPRLQVRRTMHWGVEGTSQIVGRPGDRPIVLSMTISGQENFAALNQLLTRLARNVGEHGTLVQEDIGNGVTREWRECTFEGFQPTSEAKKDEAGTLDGADKWFIEGELFFTQLIVNQD